MSANNEPGGAEPGLGSAVRRALSLLATFSLVAVLMGGVTFIAQKYLPAPMRARFLSPTPQPLGLSTVEKALNLLEQSYIHPIEERKLFQSAVKFLKEALRAQKLSVESVPDLPPEGSNRQELLTGLSRSLESAHQVAGDKMSDQKLVYVALRGLVAGLDDPYCSVFDPAEYKHFDEQMSGGNFGGIGVYMEADRAHDNRLTVVEPIEGTPAYSAGLREGDVIEKINGQSTSGWPIEKAVSHIRGEEGTPVHLGIFRPSADKHFEVDVKRAKIHVRSVSSRLLKNAYGYIRVRMFGEETGQEFDQELQKMVSRGAKGILLDLRNNGGGYVTEAIDMCSHFVPKGQTVVSVVNGRIGRHDTYSSPGGSEQIHLPVVLLVNRYSASASEITAGALRDHKLAKLVGETTFGKASVQQVEKLSDGGALKYTIAHYLTPNGRDIHKRGIPVDVEVKVTADDKTDKVLEAGEKELQSEIDAAKR